MNDQALSSDFLDALQREAFDYFAHEANPINGLIADKTQAESPASIAAVGFALSSYPVGVERGFMRRADAITRTLTTLRFFSASVQSADNRRDRIQRFLLPLSRHGERKAGLEMRTVDDRQRHPHCRHVDCRRLLLRAKTRRSTKSEHWPTRSTCRADWNWAQNGGVTVTHGWKPERGFLRYRWEGYCRGDDCLSARPGFAYASAPGRELGTVDVNIRLEKNLRSRAFTRRPALHPPVLSYLDRSSRNSGRLYARQGHRLFREQPPRYPCPAAVRDQQSSSK